VVCGRVRFWQTVRRHFLEGANLKLYLPASSLYIKRLFYILVFVLKFSVACFNLCYALVSTSEESRFSSRHGQEIFFITSPKRSDSLWGSSSPVFNWYLVLFPCDVMLTANLHRVLRWGYIFVTPNVFLVLSRENFYFTLPTCAWVSIRCEYIPRPCINYLA
jgi:hypothetical protein